MPFHKSNTATFLINELECELLARVYIEVDLHRNMSELLVVVNDILRTFSNSPQTELIIEVHLNLWLGLFVEFFCEEDDLDAVEASFFKLYLLVIT